MEGKIYRIFFAFLMGMLLLSCVGHRRVTVIYDRVERLKTGDRIYWKNQVIGSVGSMETNSRGRTAVPLHIKNNFSDHVTDFSRFLIQADPRNPENQSVRMIHLKTGGKPLPDGAVVEGSTSYSIALEKGSRAILDGSKFFQDAFDRMEREFRRLSEKEGQKKLEEQLEEWTRELKRSGKEVHRYFQKELYPRLEQAVQSLLRWLKEHGREKDGKPLEEKWDELKRTLHT